MFGITKYIKTPPEFESMHSSVQGTMASQRAELFCAEFACSPSGLLRFSPPSKTCITSILQSVSLNISVAKK